MNTKRQFHYHASAHALSGELTRPVQRVIEVQAGISLPSVGGVGSSTVENFRLDEVVSFRRAYSHVSGSVKIEKGRTFHTTHSTATVEGLNILDVVTADRVVARLSSRFEVPAKGPLPRESKVLLVGSKFENLRIAGFQTDVELDHELFLKLETFADVRNHWKAKVSDLRQSAAELLEACELEGVDLPKQLEVNGAAFCSVVKEVHFKEPGFTGAQKKKFVPSVVRRFGRHAYDVVDFGRIFLSEVLCQHGRKTLTMLRVELGCPNGGSFIAAEADADGDPPWG